MVEAVNGRWSPPTSKERGQPMTRDARLALVVCLLCAALVALHFALV